MAELTEMQKHLDHAFNMISCISVRGDDIERMADAREALRRAFKLTERNKEESKNG